VYVKSNLFAWPFLHQLIYQSAVQKPILKPQTASNASVEAPVTNKNSGVEAVCKASLEKAKP
jgi:hypothetical protein